jgi:hypothetical protein
LRIEAARKKMCRFLGHRWHDFSVRDTDFAGVGEAPMQEIAELFALIVPRFRPMGICDLFDGIGLARRCCRWHLGMRICIESGAFLNPSEYQLGDFETAFTLAAIC